MDTGLIEDLTHTQSTRLLDILETIKNKHCPATCEVINQFNALCF